MCRWPFSASQRHVVRLRIVRNLRPPVRRVPEIIAPAYYICIYGLSVMSVIVTRLSCDNVKRTHHIHPSCTATHPPYHSHRKPLVRSISRNNRIHRRKWRPKLNAKGVHIFELRCGRLCSNRKRMQNVSLLIVVRTSRMHRSECCVSY